MNAFCSKTYKNEICDGSFSTSTRVFFFLSYSYEERVFDWSVKYAVPQKLDNGLRSNMYEKRTTKSISTDAESEGGI